MKEPSESLPVRGAWIEMTCAATHPTIMQLSLPVRGAWIEIPRLIPPRLGQCVAPRAGSVD